MDFIKRGDSKMKVLMCANGKKESIDAITFARDLVKNISPEITLLAVRKEAASQIEDKWLDQAEHILEENGLKAKKKIRLGDPANQIIQECAEGKYELLVIGTCMPLEIISGITEILLDDVAVEVVYSVETSVLVVKEGKPSFNKVMICADGSPSSLQAINLWGNLKVTPQPRLNAVNVVQEIHSHFKDVLEPVGEEFLEFLGTLPGKRTQYLYEAKKILEKYNVNAKIKLREGYAGEGILKEAENEYDLIVMGQKGRENRKELVLGRHAREVVTKSKISVLITSP